MMVFSEMKTWFCSNLNGIEFHIEITLLFCSHVNDVHFFVIEIPSVVWKKSWGLTSIQFNFCYLLIWIKKPNVLDTIFEITDVMCVYLVILLLWLKPWCFISIEAILL